tara:strand:- start:34 stop:444 length:411 start_codon:yes stop_codon:yes gene_type:complete
MARSGFKMTGMSFKGESPVKKTRNYKKLASKIKNSKFGNTKLGQALGNVTEKIGNVQEKYVAGKKNLGLSTSGYDEATENSSDDAMIVNSKKSSNSEEAQANAGGSTKATDVSKLSSVLTKKKKKKAPTRKYKKKK